MSSYWLTNPELFLYAKGTDDVLLRRCKKPASSSSSSSSLVVPMKPDDFEYVETVKNHMELIANMFTWDEPDYKRLVKYIYEKRLLVNSQGFVIAELLHKAADKDGNKSTIDDANEEEEEEEVPAIIYIRSLDVLPLKPYIPKLREQPIPLRTVKYLGDVNGKAALMEENSKVTKLTARVDDLEAENIALKSKNNILDSNVTELTTGLTATTYKVGRLESSNIYLNEKVAKLMAYSYQMDSNYEQEVWMNDSKQLDWVGLQDLSDIGDKNFTFVGPRGVYPKDFTVTNVRAMYYREAKGFHSNGEATTFTVILVEDLTPHNYKARFHYSKWSTCKSQGKVYLLF